MKTSVGFRLSVTICAAILFVGVFSFISVPTHAEGAAEKARKAAEAAVAKAVAARKCKEAEEAAAKAEEDANNAEERAARAEAEAKAAETGPGASYPDQVHEGNKRRAAAAARDRAVYLRQVARRKREAYDAIEKPCDDPGEALAAAEEALQRAEALLAEKTEESGKKPPKKLIEEKSKLDKLRKDLQGTVVPPSAGATVQTKIANGLNTVTFDTLQGRVIVNLPDDMRAGDTISGTVVEEPKGSTPAEKEKNRAALEGLVIEIGGRVAPLKQRDRIQPVFDIVVNQIEAGQLQTIHITIRNGNQSYDFRIPSNEPLARAKMVPRFEIPPLGQTGRPVVIPGPFDGNSATTTLNWTVGRSGAKDSEKNTEVVSGGFHLIAESPRGAVFESPTNFTGPVEITLKEANVETKGSYRNVGVNLIAPKTSLMKGERTTLTAQVSGLEGIKQPVPLTLESQGVITMEGGMYQPLVIQPSQVGADGRYSTTRGITGVQAGGWSATATVVTYSMDVKIEGENCDRHLSFNSSTGDYTFNCPGCSYMMSDGTLMTREQFAVFSIVPIGRGTITQKGCTLTLEHNAPDRRVMATIDQCAKTGTATVDVPANKAKFTITDRNTAENTCAVP